MQHNKALTYAVAQRCRISEETALQLVEQAIKDGVLSIDPVGEVRRV